MLEKLRQMEENYHAMQEKMMDPAVVGDNQQYAQLMREYKHMQPIIEKYHEYLQAQNDFTEAREILDGEEDAELREMAQAELKGTIPKGMTKADYAEMKFGDALIEDDDFDMLVMGRTQGKGCYCYVNGVLQSQLGNYLPNYSYVVRDNEAGLEQIARGTLPHVDTMLLISDCSRRGVQAVARIAEMIDEMGLNPGQMGLIINRAPDGKLDDGVRAEIEKHGLKLFGVLPHDEAVYRCDCDGNPSAKLPDSDPMKVALRGIMQSIGL